LIARYIRAAQQFASQNLVVEYPCLTTSQSLQLAHGLALIAFLLPALAETLQ